MRGSYRRPFRMLVVTAFMFLAWGAWPAQAHAAAPESGITITPAALTLNLANGQTSATTSFAVTNNYRSAVSVSFAVEPDKTGGATLSAHDLGTVLFLAQTTMTLQSGQSAQQTLTLADNPLLPPGSQAVSMVVSQQSGTGGSVSIASRIQLPVTIIKQAGAVASFAVTSLDAPGTIFALPSSVRVAVRNTGNTTVIPHGYVVLNDPRGTPVAKGTLNSASVALGPHGTLALTTPLTHIARARLPGPYKIAVFYGLGGGQPAQQQHASLWFIAWWQLVGVAAIGSAVYYAMRKGSQKLHSKKARIHRPSSTRNVLAGRGST